MEENEEKKVPQPPTNEEEANATETVENAGATSVNKNDKEETVGAERLPRDVLYERIRTNVPDGKYDEDEQEYFRNAMSLLDKAEEGSKKYNDLAKKMARRYDEDPEEVAILMDYLEGMPLLAAIRKHKGDEALTMKEGDAGWDEFQAEGEKRKKRYQEYNTLMNEVDKNINGSIEVFNKWAEKNNLDDSQRDAVWALLQGDVDNISHGKFTEEIFDRYSSALNYAKDVAGAREQGKSEGKNEVIEAKRKQMQGSGLPQIKSESVQEEKETGGNATADFLSSLRRR